VLEKVIALDFFAQFDPQDLLRGPAGMRYRQAVLAEFDAETTASSSAR
jgi:thimet oligopeptidase